ncbi:MAG TPA: DMT family transporter [Galbitalea sp.]|nr:DMT family transporter [Galbitalea sp.]
MSLHLVTLTPQEALGIPIALVGSVFLALGAQFQHRGVNKVDAATAPENKFGLRIGQLLSLARRPSWLFGTLLLGLAIVFQLVSLKFSPLTVVQPLGVLGLVITSIVNSRVSHKHLDAASIRAIAFCVIGVGIFVTIASLTTTSVPIHDAQLEVVLIILAVILVAAALIFAFFRKRFTTLFYIVGAGILFGFVATLAKVDIDRIDTIIAEHRGLHVGDILTIVCLLGLILAGLLGSYFVQTAYSSGPPDLVVAGLTVIDPLVGVTIGIVVLGEASGAPLWAAFVFVLAGIVAIYGVFQLSKHHPQIRR